MEYILLIVIVILAINYLCRRIMDRLTIETTNDTLVTKEGFEDTHTPSLASVSKYSWLHNNDLYDDFYASVYNKIFQHEKLVQAEVAICLQNWIKGNTPKKDMIIADVCSGSCVASLSLIKQGVGTVIAIDKSPSMLNYCKNTTLSSTTLNPLQKQSIEFRLGDVVGPGTAMAAEFSHACLLYFTIYYFKDLSNLFNNLALWVKPGGGLCIEVVNKHKFVPTPDIANPWVSVSPQKFSKYRITKAKATFDTFDYDSEFILEDPRAEFKETFHFKDGSVRRQKHTLWMPDISEIVKKAKDAGWTYTKHSELNFIGFEYGYLLFFNRNYN